MYLLFWTSGFCLLALSEILFHEPLHSLGLAQLALLEALGRSVCPLFDSFVRPLLHIELVRGKRLLSHLMLGLAGKSSVALSCHG